MISSTKPNKITLIEIFVCVMHVCFVRHRSWSTAKKEEISSNKKGHCHNG